MKAVTIDQLKLKDHVRWAEDQQEFDISFVTESQIVAPHPDLMGMSAIYPSKFDILFDLQKRNITWASFETPKNFHLFGKRFFSHRLFAHFDWEGDRDEGIFGEKEAAFSNKEEKQENGLKHLTSMITALSRPQHLPHSLFEKDKIILLSLLESIEWINSLLTQINGRKLQYQKG